MSSNVTLNGVQYIVPAYNDTGWAQGAGNLSLYLAAIASSTLQPTGGSFTLTADVDFGANFGLKALFLKTETANPASAGVVRLAKTDSVKWRNNANGADIALAIDGSDNLTFGGTKVILSGLIVNADIASSAAIAYSKLALTGSILNADLAGSIAYSKLVLTGSIVNGDLTAGTILNTAINASAAIALSKLAALGTAKAVQTNASTGFLEASSVTNTELGYLSGVTSAIQTQFAATIANPLTGDLAAGAHKITGLAAGTAAGNSVRYEQLTQLQAVNTNSTSSSSTTSASFVDATGMTVTITPSSASNKILIQVSGMIEFGATASGQNASWTVLRGASNLGDTSSGVFTLTSTGTTTLAYPFNWTYVDSPATTSATTYKVQFKSDGTRTAYWNRLSLPATIRVTEVPA